MINQDVELHERVARIEIELQHVDQIVSERRGHMRNIEFKLDQMEKDLERYRGMVGAILLVATAVTTFFKLFWHDIMKLIK
jgi:ribulose 1,5-bisphosphate carboxylase large subunit-like protein